MSRQAIFEASVHYFLEPIRHLLDDESVSEIMVNRFDDVYIERDGKLEHTDAPVRRATTPCCRRSTTSPSGWAGRSARSIRCSTPGCPTAPASTP